MADLRSVPACVRSIAVLRARIAGVRNGGDRIGFVPTMGFFHAGHRSLIDRARAENDFVVVSIFVNPLQFCPGEDFDDYPRDFEADLRVCADAGVDLVFAPTRDEMYPKSSSTIVSVGELGEVLCGMSRPGHFDGVATVVAKLFAVVGECSAYFGRKDFQQLCVIRRMVDDLSLPVRVVGCPIVRDPDGLAMSSRNVYLNPEERAQAGVLRRALDAGIESVRAGEIDPAVVRIAMEQTLVAASLAEIDYTAAVSASDLTGSGPLIGEVRLLVAVYFGRVRLIDNAGCTAHQPLQVTR